MSFLSSVEKINQNSFTINELKKIALKVTIDRKKAEHYTEIKAMKAKAEKEVRDERLAKEAIKQKKLKEKLAREAIKREKKLKEEADRLKKERAIKNEKLKKEKLKKEKKEAKARQEREERQERRRARQERRRERQEKDREFYNDGFNWQDMFDEVRTKSTSAYDILGVAVGSSKQEIKKAYRALALKYHPDRNPANQAECTAKLQEINSAYESLK